MIEVSEINEIMVHKADQPHPISVCLGADGLPAKRAHGIFLADLPQQAEDQLYMNAAAVKSPTSVGRRFPDGCLLSLAMPPYQLEGAWNEDVKGGVDLGTFAHAPGNIKNDHNGDTANGG